MEFRTAHRLVTAAEPHGRRVPTRFTLARVGARAAQRSRLAAFAAFAACAASGTRHPVATFDLLATPHAAGGRAWR